MYRHRSVTEIVVFGKSAPLRHLLLNINMDIQNVAHFSLWSLVKAPLVLGNDLTKITPAILTLLTNKEVIAVNQDPLGKQGVRVAHTRYVIQLLPHSTLAIPTFCYRILMDIKSLVSYVCYG